MSLEELAGKLKEVSVVIESFCRDSLEMSAQSLSEKYVKEHGLEYIEDEIKSAFKAGFMTYRRQEEAGMLKR